MFQKLFKITCVVLLVTALSRSEPYLYNPYYSFFRYNDPYLNLAPYASQYVQQNIYQDPILTSYITQPDTLPTLNILAEVPFEIKNTFTVVPMLVVAEDNMNVMSTQGDIMGVSKNKPEIAISNGVDVLQATPAVKITLKAPIIVYSLKTSILFPSEIDILYKGFNIPIVVGAIIAPVSQNTFVSTETPVTLDVVYAVPTKPINIDYINNANAVFNEDNQSIIIESDIPQTPQNVTIIDFPDKQAEPSIEVDEEDDELVNRQPPSVLAPAGIVQSTQPQTSVEAFSNSKESPILTALREEALKYRV